MKRDAVALIVIAFVALEIFATAFGPYGYFIDELYYLSCAKRLAWGYVDHPPLSIAVLAVVRAVLGSSMVAIRLPAVAAVGCAIVVSARIAEKLGGGRFARVLAATCVATSPIAIVLGSFYSMNAFELVLVPLLALVAVETLTRDDPRGWAIFGALVGLGLENKHTMVVPAAAFAACALAGSMRRHLRTRWPWVGLAIAGVLLLPNFVWQRAHGYPSLEFYRDAQALKNIPTPPLAVLVGQIIVAGPGAVAVWIAGAAWLLRAESAKRFRFLGWAFFLLVGAMIVSRSSRPDRIAAIYPVMFAAGAVAIEGFVRKRALRSLVLAAPIAVAAVLAPLVLPILAPARAAAYATTLGIFPKLERGKDQALPQPLADRLGWPELADDVARTYLALSPEERQHAAIECPSYGQASAIDLFGPARGLPEPFSPHDNWWLWGPPERDPDVLIAVGVAPGDLDRLFAERELVLVTHCEQCTSWRRDTPIWVARHPRASLRATWPSAKHFE